MSKKLKPGEGAVNVSGDVTPITRKPVTHINTNDWGEISQRELLDQRDVLNQRLLFALQQRNQPMITAIRNGIAQIDAIVNDNRTDEFGLL